MAVWKRVSGWTDTLKKRLVETSRDDEPQRIVVDHPAVNDALLGSNGVVSSETPVEAPISMNDDGVPWPASRSRTESRQNIRPTRGGKPDVPYYVVFIC